MYIHWVRDMVFDEDRCTIRKGNAPQVIAALRNTVIALAHKLNMSVTDMRHEFARLHKRGIKVILEN
jgi:predicted transposase YbfD/YdcC